MGLWSKTQNSAWIPSRFHTLPRKFDLALFDFKILLKILEERSEQELAMEDATETMYWCHMCSRSVNPVIDGEIIECNFCQSGFVEEMDNPPDSVANDHHQAADSLWAPILIGMMNHHDHHTTTNQGASEPNAEDDDDDDDDDDQNNGGEVDLDQQLQGIISRRRSHSAAILHDDDDQNNGGEIDLDQQLQEIISRRRSHSAAILDLLQGIRDGLSVESESNEDNPESELVVLINSFNQRIRIQDSVDTTSVPSGSLGDYFIGPGFEMLLERLAESDPGNRYGTPPANKDVVEALAAVRIGESLLQCTVCLDDFEIGVEAKEMPCTHKFHSDCLLPWLELHSSCPVCRYLLPTRDDDGEPKTDAETSRNDDDVSVASTENNGSSVDSSSNNGSSAN
ncbi:unnamed protein product [Thlaspi arvense]|uniref:RING-type E3 ubiquitin transferase n=1 Tax=Thlaspi arvense TaxID=13288 RepID=A0AAU9S373_THLAR|nr:unnamed protein product [Thlaspi arvense]